MLFANPIRLIFKNFVFPCLLALIGWAGSATAGEETTGPLTHFSFGGGQMRFSELGALIANVNAKEEARFTSCQQQGNPELGFGCSQHIVTTFEPYGTTRTNGLPSIYILTGNSISEMTFPGGETISNTTDYPGFGVPVTQSCPAPFGGQSQGPAEDRTLICVKREAQSCDAQSNVGNPINVPTGCKFEREIDYATADGILKIERRYFNQHSGWVIDTLPRLLELAAGSSQTSENLLSGGTLLKCPNAVVETLVRYKPTLENPSATEESLNVRCLRFINMGNQRVVHLWQHGRHYRFVGTGNLLLADGLKGLRSKLEAIDPEANNGAAWKLTNNADDALYFRPNGTLQRHEFASGGFIDYNFSANRLQSKIDHKGRTLTYNYDSDGRLVEISLPGGGTMQYSYGAELGTVDFGLLQRVTWPDGGFIDYLYNEPEHLSGSNNGQLVLTGKMDAEGRRIGTYKYASGNAVSTEGALGIEKKTIQDLGYYSKVTDALGTVSTTYYSQPLADGLKLPTQIR